MFLIGPIISIDTLSNTDPGHCVIFIGNLTLRREIFRNCQFKQKLIFVWHILLNISNNKTGEFLE